MCRLECEVVMGWMLRATWACVLPALYMVSMPSGMMTMSEVPTRTPVPSRVTMRSCRCESDSDRGRMPARKELQLSVDGMRWVRREDSRQGHEGAQGEQHQKSVPHGEACVGRRKRVEAGL